MFNYTGGSSVFINNGTFLKAAGTNTTFLVDNGGMAFNNNGTIDLAKGALTLNAGYTPAATSRLKLSVGGPAATPLSQLRLGGIGALHGTLAVSLANGFSPTNGSTFALVTYGSVTSHFAASNCRQRHWARAGNSITAPPH